MSIFTKHERRWHEEPGQEFDLREFVGRTPTGRVAFVRMIDEQPQQLPGKHVRLVVDRRQVTIVELREPKGVVVRIPWKSFVDAGLHAEPGIARLRLDLAAQLGVTVVRFALWFDAAERSRLDRLVAQINRYADTPPVTRPTQSSASPASDTTAEVPLLDVRCAPPLNDWLVFLPGDCSAEVLRRVVATPPASGTVE